MEVWISINNLSIVASNLQTESEGPTLKVTTAGLGILGRRMCISQQ